jgi:DNA-binding NarL/FixJ family response regulator
MMYVICGANFQISNSFGGEIGRNQSMGTTRVVLADDHPIVRAGIRRLLEKAADIQVVGEASDGIEALHLVEDLDPDVLLLDVEMPGLRGTEVARRLQVAGSPVHILALSSYDDEQYIRGMLASGAAGYLTKEEAPQTLVHAVRRIARGDQGWISQRVAARMADWSQEKTSGTPALTATVSPKLLTLEREMVDAVNMERLKRELSSYRIDAQLAGVARAHAQDMVARDYFGHVTPEGDTLHDRLRQEGLDPYWAGENFLRTVRPADEAVEYAIEWFMADPPHRKNILHTHYDRIGVGVVEGPPGWYTFVLDFAGE